MKENAAIKWIVGLTVFVALGVGGLGLYLYIDEAIKGFFIS